MKDSIYVHVRVYAKVKKEMVIKKQENHFEIRVKEPAEQNQANRRVCELIANEYAVAPGKVRIVTGHRSPSKILTVTS